MRIRQDDVTYVREQTHVADIIGEHVALRPGGVGSLKGLCPFHDEKTPSFNVRPHVGLWHCFGCGEGGDVISFLQKIDHLSFSEAVEHLAGKLGYQLHYETDSGAAGDAHRAAVGQRQRLLEANRVAEQFFTEQLNQSPDAVTGRSFLAQRGFDRAAAEHFGVGFAPRSGEALLRHLRGRGFTEPELLASGLAGQGQRGLYDRFRGRLLWPIRDVAGDVVGFGARRLFEDDRIEAKYLNTPETAIYKKSQVLYGVDLAKRTIAKDREAVIVEGYTDVMACHLAGVTNAIASCGTAFGDDHVRVLRRLLGDDRSVAVDGHVGGSVVFTFDGDEAGQKAALRAFATDQRFVAQTYIAIAPEGMDPCELRQQRGDLAVRELIAARQPLFQFAIRTTAAAHNLDTAEGRVAALRATAPLVAKIRDTALRPEYARQLAGWLGMEVEPVLRAVRTAARDAGRPRDGSTGSGRPGDGGTHREMRDAPSEHGGGNVGGAGGGGDAGATSAAGARRPATVAVDPRDPVARVERAALECILQVPQCLSAEVENLLGDNPFEVPAYRAIYDAVRGSGGSATAQQAGAAAWVAQVRDQAAEVVQPLVEELAVAALPATTQAQVGEYATDVLRRLAEVALSRAISTVRSRLQRLQPTDADYEPTFRELLAAEDQRRTLREHTAS